MSKRRKSPSRNPKIQCSDCGQYSFKKSSQQSWELIHEETCPAALALDDVMASDRTWFEDRPGATHYCRLLTTAERIEFADMAEVGSLPNGSIICVRQVAPGVRARNLYVPGKSEVIPSGTIGLFGHPETFYFLQKRLNSIGMGLPEAPTAKLLDDLELEVRLFRPLPKKGKNPVWSSIAGLVGIPSGGGLPIPFRDAV